MQPIQDIFPLLNEPKQIAITMHQKPDADAMGSTLGLYHVLTQLGHTVQVVSPTNWARWVDWMPAAKEVLDYELHRADAEAWLDRADWLFCLDFNHMGRTKNMAAKLSSLNCVKILID